MQSFSAWKVGAPYYVPLLAGGILAGVLLRDTAFWPIGVIIAALGVFTLNFFRDPPRRIPCDAAAIVSPADGKVVAIENLASTEYYDGPCTRISIFLNVFNVHVNRSPYDGRVVAQEHRPGKFLNAAAPESSAVNESAWLRLDTPAGPMTVRQIAGLIARRIVCLAKVSDTLTKGQRFGMIKFGSRTELYLPPSCTVCVVMGQKVKGGATVVAKTPNSYDAQ